MCKPNSIIHFCTCASVSKKPWPKDEILDKTEYNKTNFIWTLYKFLGETDTETIGNMIMPVQILDEELTSEAILQELNSENAFDFDYAPSEGDNLQIRKDYIYKSIRGILRPDLFDYMSFIYRNGSWKEDVYYVFGNKIRKINRGQITRS